jgi:hypothetical protein
MAVVKEHYHEVAAEDLGDPPVITVTSSEGAIEDHEAAANPHPTYTTAAELAAAVDAAIDALVTGAPGALDTLNELAAAIGDDADFAGTITAALAGKVPTTRTLTAGTGLTGGGDLSANRTVAVDFGEVGDVSTQEFGDAAAAGSTSEAADAGHKHAMPRVVRGRVNADGTVAQGTGFTVNKTGAGAYEITFTTAFSALPIVLAVTHESNRSASVDVPSSTSVVVIRTANYNVGQADYAFSFIAIEA